MNPWGGATLEWHCSTPPPHDNFSTPPTVGDPYDFEGMTWDPGQQGWVSTRGPGTATAKAH
jgi:cytochrome c oxidase subunit 1